VSEFMGAVITVLCVAHGLRTIRGALIDWRNREYERALEVQHQAVTLPHVTATTPYVRPTPRVTYALQRACPDCEFEVATMFGGEVAVPVRTSTCPRHSGYDGSDDV
jgi:hypothetical protein